MTTQTTKQDLEEKADRLWNCFNGMRLDFLEFAEYTNRAVVADYPRPYVERAEEALAKIEDAIKRYRENRLQEYEED